MKVKDLKRHLKCYEDDTEVVFSSPYFEGCILVEDSELRVDAETGECRCVLSGSDEV